VILGSPPASHRQGPHYLGILRHTDIPQVLTMMGERVRLYGETAGLVPRNRICASLAECLGER
jgi:hypothetical protein